MPEEESKFEEVQEAFIRNVLRSYNITDPEEFYSEIKQKVIEQYSGKALDKISNTNLEPIVNIIGKRYLRQQRSEFPLEVKTIEEREGKESLAELIEEVTEVGEVEPIDGLRKEYGEVKKLVPIEELIKLDKKREYNKKYVSNQKETIGVLPLLPKADTPGTGTNIAEEISDDLYKKMDETPTKIKHPTRSPTVLFEGEKAFDAARHLFKIINYLDPSPEALAEMAHIALYNIPSKKAQVESGEISEEVKSIDEILQISAYDIPKKGEEIEIDEYLLLHAKEIMKRDIEKKAEKAIEELEEKPKFSEEELYNRLDQVISNYKGLFNEEKTDIIKQKVIKKVEEVGYPEIPNTGILSDIVEVVIRENSRTKQKTKRKEINHRKAEESKLKIIPQKTSPVAQPEKSKKTSPYVFLGALIGVTIASISTLAFYIGKNDYDPAIFNKLNNLEKYVQTLDKKLDNYIPEQIQKSIDNLNKKIDNTKIELEQYKEEITKTKGEIIKEPKVKEPKPDITETTSRLEGIIDELDERINAIGKNAESGIIGIHETFATNQELHDLQKEIRRVKEDFEKYLKKELIDKPKIEEPKPEIIEKPPEEIVEETKPEVTEEPKPTTSKKSRLELLKERARKLKGK